MFHSQKWYCVLILFINFIPFTIILLVIWHSLLLGLPQWNDIFGYFTAISWYQEFWYNDINLLLLWRIFVSGFHCICPFSNSPPPPSPGAGLQGTLPAHWRTLRWGGYNIYMFLVWISKPIISHIKEEVTFLLIFYYHISAFLHRCHSLKLSLCHCYHFSCVMLLFHSEFYRNIALSVYQNFQYHRFLTTQFAGIECHAYV